MRQTVNVGLHGRIGCISTTKGTLTMRLLRRETSVRFEKPLRSSVTDNPQIGSVRISRTASTSQITASWTMWTPNSQCSLAS